MEKDVISESVGRVLLDALKAIDEDFVEVRMKTAKIITSILNLLEGTDIAEGLCDALAEDIRRRLHQVGLQFECNTCKEPGMVYTMSNKLYFRHSLPTSKCKTNEEPSTKFPPGLAITVRATER